MFRPMISLLLAIACTCACMLVAGRAEADAGPGDRARATALFEEAEKADDTFAFARALELYDEVRALDPGSRHAPRAEARGAVLRAHAAGGFRVFTELERVRRDPKLASDAGAIDALVALADRSPGDPSEVEVWVLAAEAYAYRLGRPGDAARLYGRVVSADRADAIVGKKAARDLVTMQLASGDLEGAQATVALATAHGRADERLARDVRRVARRGRLHQGALAIVLLVTLAALGAVARAARKSAEARGAIAASVGKISRIAIAYAIYVAVGGAILASRYDTGTGTPFLVLGIVIVPLVLLARAWGAAGRAGGTARAARATACAASAMAAAFLVLEGVNGAFLEGMGL